MTRDDNGKVSLTKFDRVFIGVATSVTVLIVASAFAGQQSWRQKVSDNSTDIAVIMERLKVMEDMKDDIKAIREILWNQVKDKTK